MEAPYILISEIHPKKDKKIDRFDKHSKYVVKISASTDLAEELFKYAEDFFKSSHIITEFILYAEHPDIGKLDTYFLVIAFLYRHCMEVSLKAIGFQYINDIEERRKFVKGTRHNLSEILNVVENKCNSTRPDEEIEWLKNILTIYQRLTGNHLFLPMCYLYRNCVELSLKAFFLKH